MYAKKKDGTLVAGVGFFFSTCLWYLANHNALDSWPIREHCAYQNSERFIKARVMYGMCKIMCFLNRNCVKFIFGHKSKLIFFCLKQLEAQVIIKGRHINSVYNNTHTPKTKRKWEECNKYAY